MSHNPQNLPTRTNGSAYAGPTVGAPAPPPPVKNTVDISSIWRTIRRGKWIIFLVLLLSTGGAALFSYLATPEYEAESIVQLKTSGSALPGDEPLGGRPTLSAEIGVVQRSADLARLVSERFIQEARSHGNPEEYPLLSLSNVGDIKADASVIARSVYGRMEFRPIEANDMISMTAVSSSRQEAALLANVYAQVYEEFSLEKSREKLVAAGNFLKERIAEEQRDLDGLEISYGQYVRNQDIITSGEDGERTITEYFALESERSTAEQQLRTEQRILANLQTELQQLQGSASASQLQTLSRRLNVVLDEIDRLLAEIEPWYTNNPALRGNEASEPELKNLIDQLAQKESEQQALQQQISNESIETGLAPSDEGGQFTAIAEKAAAIRDKEFEISSLQSTIEDLDRRISSLRSRLDVIPSQKFDVLTYQRRMEEVQGYIRDLASRLQEVELHRQAELGFVDVVRRAQVPMAPVRPDFKTNIILSLLLGLTMGIGIAFVREAIRKRLQTPDDLKEMGYKILGIIPSMNKEIKTTFDGKEAIELNGKMRSSALMTLHSPWSSISEHYRLVRTNIQQSANREAPKVLLITSPEPSDGKSVTAVNLAISLAGNGKKVLLVDADLRRSSTNKLLGTPKGEGLAEILISRSEGLKPIVDYKTDIDGLYVVQAGQTEIPPPELLGSARMSQFVNHYRNHFDSIVIDSPPVLAVTDALVIAPVCDAAVVVVSANKSTPSAVTTTVNAIESIGLPIAGMIFNKFDAEKAGGGKYYGYEYSYGYAYTSDE